MCFGFCRYIIKWCDRLNVLTQFRYLSVCRNISYLDITDTYQRSSELPIIRLVHKMAKIWKMVIRIFPRAQSDVFKLSLLSNQQSKVHFHCLCLFSRLALFGSIRQTDLLLFRQTTAYAISDCDWSSDVALPISGPLRYGILCPNWITWQVYQTVSFLFYCMSREQRYMGYWPNAL